MQEPAVTELKFVISILPKNVLRAAIRAHCGLRYGRQRGICEKNANFAAL